MVHSPVSDQSNLTDVGVSLNRPVCNGGELQVPNVCFFLPESSDVGSGRIELQPGRGVRVCVSPVSTHSKSPTEDSDYPMQSHSGSSTLAVPIVVQPIAPTVRLSKESFGKIRPAEEAKVDNILPIRTVKESSCLSVIRQIVRSKHFPDKCRTVLPILEVDLPSACIMLSGGFSTDGLLVRTYLALQPLFGR